ncbi:DUF2156 domain-containing protein [Clostridium estertheticum]|uniref:bifunctional lysylphosphatidylglycerol flippase/synthetase MprF n=1 Tax=Clostridium estertheticum TaxID=238834 RepID=UPI001C0C843D|nr:DUF2156 domain-containing protein [Clostridium estertheticum]MBU3179450.1 DUF2156 domain-containing protein [Clostridium estertheticum]
MKKISAESIKNSIINAAVLLTLMLGIENILYEYYNRIYVISYISKYFYFFNPETLVLHRTISVITGFVLIFTSYKLYKRMRMAWVISICMLSVSMLMHILNFHSVLNPAITVEFIVINILCFNYKNFEKASDPINLRNSIFLGITIIFIIIVNTCFAAYELNIRLLSLNGFNYAVLRTLRMLFLIDFSTLGHLSARKLIFVKTEIAINWTGVLATLFFILKPLVYQPFVTAFDKEKVRKLLNKYGENSLSYITIEDDKKYYFGNNVEGAIAYTTVSGVAVCAGDPVCSDENMPLLITEFITYCKQNNFAICFCHTLEKHIPLYTYLGFGKTKCGEEAMFDLETYTLTGGKAAKIRNAINHASALGITISEYKPLVKRDKLIEQQISEVSDEWLKNKNSSELSFMLGTISLNNPMDRRYFAAYDNKTEMLGFIVFSPFAGGKGYLADITRRRNNAPIGVMEKITIEAFNKMKLEGVKWGTLGLAPLVNVADDGGVAGKLFQFVYEKLNSFYGFKGLYHYKKKYSPTVWENRYIVYYPKIFTPKIAYSIIKAQNPKGVGDFLLVQLKSFLGAKKEEV